MSDRKLYALGTGSQVPTRKRNQSCYFVKWGKEGFLFDPGEGAQRQMIYSGVSSNEITKIFITHFHGDHCLGLPGILQRLSLDKVQHPVEIYFPAYGMKYYENLKNSSVYYDEVNIDLHTFKEAGEIFADKYLKVETKKLDHRIEAWGYRISEPDSFTINKEKIKKLDIPAPLVGKLKEDKQIELNGKIIKIEDAGSVKKGLSFAFVTDTKYCRSAIELAEDCNLLVIESTYLSDHEKEAEERGHLTAAGAAEIALKAGVNELALTHFSQRYKKVTDFVNEAKELHNNVRALNDGDIIDFRKKRNMNQ